GQAAPVGARGRRRQPAGDLAGTGRAPRRRGARAACAAGARRAAGAAVFAGRAPPPAQAAGSGFLRSAGALLPGAGTGPAHRPGRPGQCLSGRCHSPCPSRGIPRPLERNTMSSPENEPHPPEAEAAILRIVAGLHAGASRPLSRREMVLVGSGDDCDVVLADLGVAPHHALVNAVDGRFHLRALDAPLELPGRTLHPGDPVEVAQVRRIGLGQAAIAFGRADAPEWLALAPGIDAGPPPRRPPAFASRLPMIAGVAVLALAGLAIFAAWMPSAPPPVDVEQRLRELAREYRVGDARITRAGAGRAVLAGMVDDDASRVRLDARIADEELPASLALRSGQDLASDVAEVMRTGGYTVQAEYLGDRNVRVTGALGGDARAVRDFIQSRAMAETGVNTVEPVDLDEPVADAVADAADITR